MEKVPGALIQLVSWGPGDVIMCGEGQKDKKIICNNFDESIQYYFIENEDGVYRKDFEYIYEQPMILDHVDPLQKPESVYSFSIKADKKREIPECDYQTIRDELYKEIGESTVPIYSV